MKMLKAEQVAERIGYSRSSLYKKISDGEFPRGNKIGSSNRWPDYVVDAWNILFWELREQLPEMSQDTIEIIKTCVAKAKQSHVA